MKRLLIAAVALLMINLVYAQETTSSKGNASDYLNIPVEYINTGNAKYDQKVYNRELIKFLRDNYGLPAYQDNGNKDIDIPKFNRAIAEWHIEYPEFD
ncbi:MAG: hypothetical protein C0596_14395 [Marinilabiliales bacterium]|nr:MAG: hypothetical protein C0596_14395 [Marinilabiliales bacterium]